MLKVVDEFARECLAIRINYKLKSSDVIDVLSDLLILRGVPAHIRSDNGSEFVAKAVQEWVAAVHIEDADMVRQVVRKGTGEPFGAEGLGDHGNWEPSSPFWNPVASESVR